MTYRPVGYAAGKNPHIEHLLQMSESEAAQLHSRLEGPGLRSRLAHMYLAASVAVRQTHCQALLHTSTSA